MAGRLQYIDDSTYDSIDYSDKPAFVQAGMPYMPGLPPPTPPRNKNFKKSPSKPEPGFKPQGNQAPPLPPWNSSLTAGGSGDKKKPGNLYTPESTSQRKNLTLADFVKKHSQALPLRVTVIEGYCGNDEKCIISAGDTYNFHFIKKEKTMSVQDSAGTHFSVPLNTEIQFGMLYDPVGDVKQAVQGYSFKTIGELASYPKPPDIVRVTKKYDSGDPKSSVEPEEILIVKSVGRSTLKKRQSTKVYSFLTRGEKTLYADCEGNFLTDPGSVRLYLSDIHKFFKDQLPIKAMIFLNSDVTDDSISHLVSEVITLTHVSIESALIATSGNSEEEEENEYWNEGESLISIPISLDISVDIISDDESDYEDLYDNTMNLFDNFNPTKVRDVTGATPFPAASTTTPPTVRKAIRAGYEFRGLEIERPRLKTFDHGPKVVMVQEKDYEGIDSKEAIQGDLDVTKRTAGRRSPLPGKGETSTSAQASPLSSPWAKRKMIVPPLPERERPNNKELPDPQQIFKQSVASLERKTSRDSESKTKPKERNVTPNNKVEGTEIDKQLSLLRSSLNDLSQRFDKLQEEVKQIQQALKSRKQSSQSLSDGESSRDNYVSLEAGTSTSDNVERLRNMGNIEVLRLLDRLNLGQYKEKFQYEQLDGDTLAECDEDVLQNEVGISNRIHRMRLLKIITGKTSILDVMGDRAPYAS